MISFRPVNTAIHPLLSNVGRQVCHVRAPVSIFPHLMSTPCPLAVPRIRAGAETSGVAFEAPRTPALPTIGMPTFSIPETLVCYWDAVISKLVRSSRRDTVFYPDEQELCISSHAPL